MTSDLFLCTTIGRPNEDGVAGECDVVIYFRCVSYTPGCKATWTDPAWSAEAEFEFVRAEFDGGEPDDAPGPLTEAEIAGLRAWFEAHYAEAMERYEDQAADDGPDYADAHEREWTLAA